jgi:hypothetical protein
MLVYADPADLATFDGGPPPVNAVALLRHSSLLVAEATRLAVYDTAADGVPTDLDVLQAFKDATCAHASVLAANSIDPRTVATGTAISQTSIGGATIAYAGADAAATARQTLATRLCPEAWRILSLAGLTNNAPYSYGG